MQIIAGDIIDNSSVHFTIGFIMQSVLIKHLTTLTITCLMLFACSAGPTYLGQTIIEKQFAVDGGKSLTLPVTRNGAVPIENETYRIENAGLIASVSKGKPEDSELTWAFSVLAKKSNHITAVVAEKVSETGELTLIIKDNTPTLKNRQWYGKSAPVPMTKASVPWLYTSADSTFIFKFTITHKDGSSIVMYQPSIISSRAKGLYLKMIYSQS